MRSMWKGAVSFGLVSIPIHLYVATESKNISFRQVHVTDGARIQTKRICSADGEEVPYSEVAKGHETEDGGMVILTDADIAALPVPSAKTVEVLEFVPLEAIDPIYFDKSYYLEPQKAAVKPYLLLRDALHKSGQVAIAKIALRQRESLAVLRVHADVLVLNTMLWPDEVRTPDFGFLREDAPQTSGKELAMAGSLIDSMSDEVFDPRKYDDAYRDALESLIEAKIAGREVATPSSAARDAEVIDLMSALSASVKAASKTTASTSKRASKGTKSTSSVSGAGGAAAKSNATRDTKAPTTQAEKQPAAAKKPSTAGRGTTRRSAQPKATGQAADKPRRPRKSA
ncbi:MAG: Ku protein [Sciscionella sp.]